MNFFKITLIGFFLLSSCSHLRKKERAIASSSIKVRYEKYNSDSYIEIIREDESFDIHVVNEGFEYDLKFSINDVRKALDQRSASQQRSNRVATEVMNIVTTSAAAACSAGYIFHYPGNDLLLVGAAFFAGTTALMTANLMNATNNDEFIGRQHAQACALNELQQDQVFKLDDGSFDRLKRNLLYFEEIVN